jgi:hypothetical protein
MRQPRMGNRRDRPHKRHIWSSAAAPRVLPRAPGAVGLSRPFGSLSSPVAGHQALLSRLQEDDHQPLFEGVAAHRRCVARRFEAEQLARLVDKSWAPKAAARNIWLPLIVQVNQRRIRMPRSFGSGACWHDQTSQSSMRTVGRIMALKKFADDNIGHVPKKGVKKVPGLYDSIRTKLAVGLSAGCAASAVWKGSSTLPPHPRPPGLGDPERERGMQHEGKRRERAKLPSPSTSASDVHGQGETA